MYTYIRVCRRIDVQMHICIYVHIHRYVYMNMCVFVYLCRYVRTYVYVILVDKHTDEYVHTCIYACVKPAQVHTRISTTASIQILVERRTTEEEQQRRGGRESRISEESILFYLSVYSERNKRGQVDGKAKEGREDREKD